MTRLLRSRAAWSGLGIAVAIAAAGALAFGDALFDRDRTNWIEIAEEPFVRRIDASGELRSANTAVIGCPPITRMWNFTLTWLADEGRQVVEGEPVARFDGQQLQDRLQLMVSRLETARSELQRVRIQQQTRHEQLVLEQAEARARHARLEQKLAVPGHLQQRTELDKLRLDHEFGELELELIAKRLETQRANQESVIGSARYRVNEYEREIAQLQKDVAALQIVAPRGGFVVHAADWNGNKPKVGETVWAGRSILEIADLSRMEVLAEVAERDARHVRAGQAVEVRLDATPDRVFTGTVRELGRLFRQKSPTVPTMVFEATIDIDAPDAELMRPGMAAGVEILARDETPAIHIPERAIEPLDGRPTVRVRRDGTVERVAVELGPRWQGRVVVERGLVVGDEVEVPADAS